MWLLGGLPHPAGRGGRYDLELALPAPEADHLLQGGAESLDFGVDIHDRHIGGSQEASNEAELSLMAEDEEEGTGTANTECQTGKIL